MYQINTHSVLGRVGSEPAIRHTQSGKIVASFSLATSYKWTDKTTGEEKENTTWHRVVVFRESTAKFVQNYLKKGALVFVQGSIQQREWTTEEGEKKTITEILVSGYQAQVMLPDPGSPALSVGRIMGMGFYRGASEERKASDHPASQNSSAPSSASDKDKAEDLGKDNQNSEEDDEIPF